MRPNAETARATLQLHPADRTQLTGGGQPLICSMTSKVNAGQSPRMCRKTPDLEYRNPCCVRLQAISLHYIRRIKLLFL